MREREAGREGERGNYKANHVLQAPQGALQAPHTHRQTQTQQGAFQAPADSWICLHGKYQFLYKAQVQGAFKATFPKLGPGPK